MLPTHGLRPIRDQVLVRQDPLLERLASGLYVPETAARVLQEDYATVLAVGPACTELAVGDRVLFARRPGTALITDPREGGREEWRDLLMLRETDVVGVITEE